MRYCEMLEVVGGLHGGADEAPHKEAKASCEIWELFG